jgi:hypothetical protein
MSRLLKLVAGGMLAVSGMTAAVGCSSEPDVETPPRTEGERLRLEAARKEKKAEMMLRAEKLITEGKGKQAEGQSLKSQGKTVEGEKTQAEGEALIREGEALRKQAEQMETSVELDTSSGSPTTRPTRDDRD